MNVHEWIEAYGRAWRERDADRVVGLFTEDASYNSHPFRDPHVGSAGVRAYWTKATRDQRDLELRFGEPIVAGNKAAVEWWAIMRLDDGSIGTLPGCLYLRFAPDGRCQELREYWAWKEERVEAPEGWGL